MSSAAHKGDRERGGRAGNDGQRMISYNEAASLIPAERTNPVSWVRRGQEVSDRAALGLLPTVLI